MRAVLRSPAPTVFRLPVPALPVGSSRRWVCLALSFLLACLASQPAAGQDAYTSFQDRLSSLINQPKYESAFWGLQIVSLENDEILFAHNERKRFLPASGMKLLIAAAALDLWGPNYRFRTPVFLEGRLDGRGRALGDLVLAGRGDPNLERRLYDPEEEDLPINASPQFIEGIADQLVQQGIRRVEGNIIADSTLFLDEPHGPHWSHGDLFWHYGAPCSALAVYENIYYVSLSPGDASGDPGVLEVIPRQGKLTTVNGVKTLARGGKPDIRIGRNRAGTRLTVLGDLPQDHPTLTYALSVPDPDLNAARLLKSSLERRGVPVVGQPRARTLNPLEVLEEGKLSITRARERQFRYSEHQRLASWRSLPLIESLKILVKTSRNLYAEMLLRGLGAEISGVGSLETGVEALEEFLTKSGISEEQLNLSDGSGLSRTNLLTPESVVRLLQYMDRHPQAEVFRECLPVAGQDGTLKHRMKGTAAEGRIFAKTGTLKFVSSLSGYVTTLEGGRMAFSIMTNNYRGPTRQVRGTIDAICALMAEFRWKSPAAAEAPRDRP